MKNLSEILPLYGVEQDMILSKRGDITIAYELVLPEIFTLSNHEYEAFHQVWVKAMKLLPVGCVLHKQDWFVKERVVGDFEKEHHFLSQSSERFFHERPYLEHRCYLMLTMRPGLRKPVNSLFSSLLRKHIVPVETLDPGFAKGFEGVCSQFVQVLREGGFVGCNRLGNEQLLKLVNRYLSLSEDGMLRDIEFNPGVRVGEKECVLYSLGDADDLPRYCGARIDYEKYSSDTVKFPIGFVSALGQLLSCDHIYNQYLFIEDSGIVIKQLEGKKRRLQSLAPYARENEYARASVELFLNEAVAGSAQVVKAHFNVLAWTDKVSDLQAVRNLCLAALSQIDTTPRIETAGASQIFWAGIPGNAADFPVNDCFMSFSHVAACFLNLETNYRSSMSPVGLRLGDRISGRPIHVDISDEPMSRGIISNRNKFIIGPSGSGKSFFTNHMMRTYYEQGAHVLIIDVGHSYQGLCELVGGYYFTYIESRPISFNPFYLAPGEVLDTEKKESLKALLLAAAKKEGEEFSRSEYVGLSNAIQSYYEAEVEFRCFDSFYEFLQHDFSLTLQEVRVREQDFDLVHFLYVLRPFYKGGEFDYLLNAQENLDLLNQGFVVFELDTIKDHPVLFPIVTIIIMEAFISKTRKLKGIRKVLNIEEAWKNLAKAGMSAFIQLVVKTLRKYYGELVIVTQEIEDIISSPIVKGAIINNSDCKIMLDQSKYENRFEQVQELLGLTDKEKAMVLSLNKSNDPSKKYKEVFISLGGRVAKVYRVEVSLEEYFTYTTEEKEKLLVRTAAEQLGSMEAAIKSLVL